MKLEKCLVKAQVNDKEKDAKHSISHPWEKLLPIMKEQFKSELYLFRALVCFWALHTVPMGL